jgi:hypothetical protein
MTTNPLTDYMLHIVDVACDGPTSHNPPAAPSISSPATFIAETLRALSSPGVLITRTGTERAADILFSHPDVRALFRNIDATVALRAIINGEILPGASADADGTLDPPGSTRGVFRDHWTYIIGPAMDEHVAISRLTSN